MEREPRYHVRALHTLRTAGDTEGVVDLASDLWESFVLGRTPDPVGIASVCQITFITLMDAEQDDRAQVWRARGTLAAVQTGELNVAAMLLLPIAFAANDVGGIEGEGRSALLIMEELGRAAEVLGDDWDGPGPSVDVVLRAQHEKTGYFHWRHRRYADAAAAYERARPYADQATPGGARQGSDEALKAKTRDQLRVEAGALLAELGLDEQQRGALDVERARLEFTRLLAEARAGGWNDIGDRLERSVSRLTSGSLSSVQELEPVEVEGSHSPWASD